MPDDASNTVYESGISKTETVSCIGIAGAIQKDMIEIMQIKLLLANN